MIIDRTKTSLADGLYSIHRVLLVDKTLHRVVVAVWKSVKSPLSKVIIALYIRLHPVRSLNVKFIHDLLSVVLKLNRRRLRVSKGELGVKGRRRKNQNSGNRLPRTDVTCLGNSHTSVLTLNTFLSPPQRWSRPQNLGRGTAESPPHR